jgi:hypothetical protein
MIALIYTPWFVAADQELMAPAIIVIMLDMITIGGDAVIRAMVPLMLAIVTAIVVALTLGLITRLFRAKQG